MKHLKVGNIAFWRYDGAFKPLLSGEISLIHKAGKNTGLLTDVIETENFGKGHCFRPLFCLPPKEGEELAREMEHLETVYTERYKQDRAAFKACMLTVCGEYHVAAPVRSLLAT